MNQIAAGLLWLSAIGLAIPGLIGIRSLLEGKGVPLVMGYPSYGGGGFERAGLPTTVPLLIAFLFVLALEAIAGWLLWHGQRDGAVLAIALLIPGAIFWWGFDLPYPPIIAAARTVVIILGLSDIRPICSGTHMAFGELSVGEAFHRCRGSPGLPSLS